MPTIDSPERSSEIGASPTLTSEKLFTALLIVSAPSESEVDHITAPSVDATTASPNGGPTSEEAQLQPFDPKIATRAPSAPPNGGLDCRPTTTRWSPYATARVSWSGLSESVTAGSARQRRAPGW